MSAGKAGAARGRTETSVEETIVRVFFDDLPTARQIAAALEPIESKYENGYLVVEVTAEQLQRLQQRGLRTEPVSAQELSTILAPPREIQSAQAPEQAVATPRAGISGFSCYRTVEEAPHDAGVGAAGMGIGDAGGEELIGGKEGIGAGALQDGRDRSGRIEGLGGGQKGGLGRGAVHGGLGNDNYLYRVLKRPRIDRRTPLPPLGLGGQDDSRTGFRIGPRVMVPQWDTETPADIG